MQGGESQRGAVKFQPLWGWWPPPGRVKKLPSQWCSGSRPCRFGVECLVEAASQRDGNLKSIRQHKKEEILTYLYLLNTGWEHQDDLPLITCPKTHFATLTCSRQGEFVTNLGFIGSIAIINLSDISLFVWPPSPSPNWDKKKKKGRIGKEISAFCGLGAVSSLFSAQLAQPGTTFFHLLRYNNLLIQSTREFYIKANNGGFTK